MMLHLHPIWAPKSELFDNYLKLARDHHCSSWLLWWPLGLVACGYTFWDKSFIGIIAYSTKKVFVKMLGLIATILIKSAVQWWHRKPVAFENFFPCFSYNICIRQEAGYCCVRYQVCPDESSNDSFTLSAFKDTEADRIATQDSECTADYVTIAASSATCSRYNFSSFQC